MHDLIEILEQEVKAARKTGNIPALLKTAQSAIAQLESAAGKTPDQQAAFLNSARKIAYNCAADAWPYWEIGTPPCSESELQTAQAVAEKCQVLTAQLDGSAMQRGNAIWLIGAFDLARGRYDEAARRFQAAASAFADETEAVLMAQGYRAIASSLSGTPSQAPDLDTIIEKLNALATEDANGFSEQLKTSRQLFLAS